mgnify:CR=1 FL=1
MNRIIKRVVSIILSVILISSSGIMSVSAESDNGLSTFISFGYNGYLSLDNDYIEVPGDDDDE